MASKKEKGGIDVINLQPERVEENRNNTCRNGDSTNFLEILIVCCVHAENNQFSCSTQHVHFQISDQNFSLTTIFCFFVCLYFSFPLVLLLYFLKKILVSIWLPFFNRIHLWRLLGITIFSVNLKVILNLFMGHCTHMNISYALEMLIARRSLVCQTPKGYELIQAHH